MPDDPAATYRLLHEKEAGGVKMVVRAGTVAVAMYCGMLPAVVMPAMMDVVKVGCRGVRARRIARRHYIRSVRQGWDLQPPKLNASMRESRTAACRTFGNHASVQLI